MMSARLLALMDGRAEGANLYPQSRPLLQVSVVGRSEGMEEKIKKTKKKHVEIGSDLHDTRRFSIVCVDFRYVVVF